MTRAGLIICDHEPITILFLGFDAGYQPIALSGMVKVGVLRRDLATSGMGTVLLAALGSSPGVVSRTRAKKSRNHVSVKDFGVLGNGSVADSAKIQAAIDSVKVGGANAGKRLLFPSGGVYVCENLICDGLKDIELIGYGATVKASQRVKSYFNMEGSQGGNFFKGFRFDQMQDVLPIYTEADYAQDVYNCPIYALQNSGGVTVEDCEFVKQYTTGIFWRISQDLVVTKCSFDAPVCNQTYNGVPAAQWYQSIHVQTVGGEVLIRDCQFTAPPFTNPALGNCAVYASGVTGALKVINNRAIYQGRDNTGTHRLGVFDVYGDARNVYVVDNIAENVMAQFMRLSSTRTGHVRGNSVTVNSNAEFDYSTFTIESVASFIGGQIGCQDIWIENNTFIDLAGRGAFAVGVISYDWGSPATGVRVDRNNFIGCRRSFVLSGPFYDVAVCDNKSRLGPGTIQVQLQPGMTANVGTEATSRFDRLVIARNSIFNPVHGSGANGIDIGIGAPATTAFVGAFTVDDNDVRGVANGGNGLTLSMFSSNRANSKGFVRRNRVAGYNNSFFIRDGGECFFEDNHSIDAGTAPLLHNPGEMLGLHQRGNRAGRQL